MDNHKSYQLVRALLVIFIVGLLTSGLTAFPLIAEINLLMKVIGPGTVVETLWPEMTHWISFVHQGLLETNNQYPFMLYGTDWLAYAHIMIAIAFIGPLRDPIRNIWVVEFGMIACLLLIPLALICGSIRGIPFFWIVIDCSFGVFGLLPLGLAYQRIKRIAHSEQHEVMVEPVA